MIEIYENFDKLRSTVLKLVFWHMSPILLRDYIELKKFEKLPCKIMFTPPVKSAWKNLSL